MKRFTPFALPDLCPLLTGGGAVDFSAPELLDLVERLALAEDVITASAALTLGRVVGVLPIERSSAGPRIKPVCASCFLRFDVGEWAYLSGYSVGLAMANHCRIPLPHASYGATMLADHALAVAARRAVKAYLPKPPAAASC